MISCTFKEPSMLQLLSQQLPNKVKNVGHTVQHVPSLWKVYKAQYLQKSALLWSLGTKSVI